MNIYTSMSTKKHRVFSPISGDIEMQEIRPHKRLGRKTKRLAPNRNIYRQRVKLSRCRKVKKTQCISKRECKYTKGLIRTFCRKRKNQRV